MKSSLNKRYLFIGGVCFISIITILIPVYWFVDQFNDYNISDNIALWGNFGDYFGGILNPIISFFSLFLLAYLTIIVARDSNTENHKLNIHLRKMDAYNHIAKDAFIFIDYIQSVTHFTEMINVIIDTTGSYEELQLSIRKEMEFVSNSSRKIRSYIHSLYGFRLNYEYLFDFNFDSEQYVALDSNFKEFESYTNKLELKIKSMGFSSEKDLEALQEILDLGKNEGKSLMSIAETFEGYLGKLQEELNGHN